MTDLLKNFSIADCIAIGDTKSTSEHLNCFDALIKDGAIDSVAVTMALSLLNQSVGDLFNVRGVKAPNRTVLTEKIQASLLWLEEFIKSKFDYFPHPGELMSLLYLEHEATSQTPPGSLVPLLAIYTIVCVDRMATELKVADGKMALKYSMLAAGGISAAYFCTTVSSNSSFAEFASELGRRAARKSSFAEFASELGKRAAHEAHTETRQLKEEVRQHWIKHIDRALSNDDAATLLKEHFPLKMRTLSRYVSEFKKAAYR